MKRLTWKEIKTKYPDQWITIAEPEYMDDIGTDLVSGIVLAADADFDILLEKSAEKKDKVRSFKFTGKIRPFLGLQRWIIGEPESQ